MGASTEMTAEIVQFHGVAAGTAPAMGGEPFVVIAFCDGKSIRARYGVRLADAHRLRARLDWAIRCAPLPAEMGGPA
jgi:hypothetical protein